MRHLKRGRRTTPPRASRCRSRSKRGHRPKFFVGEPQSLSAGRRGSSPSRTRRGSPRSCRPRRRVRARSCRTPAAVTTLQCGGHAVSQAHPRLLDDSEYGGHRLGHGGRIADRGQLDHPTRHRGSRSRARAATSIASRVLPTPPTPVNVTNRCALSAVSNSATSDSRDRRSSWSAGRRLPGVGSSVFSGGNSVRKPGPGPGTAPPVWRYRVIAGVPDRSGPRR